MINAVLIDDERPALWELDYMLSSYDVIQVAGMFTNPLQAMAEMGELNPQVVFLDINMPQLQGMDAASQILDQCPQADIVFVTAYDQYAVEAFEVNALDYIMKPITKKRFAKTIQRIINKTRNSPTADKELKFMIQTFGRFQVGWEGGEPIKWRSEKTKELFAFLLHHAGQEVSKDEILETVFPDTNLERSAHQLYNGIYYIRKTLQEYGINRKQVSIGGSYILKIDERELDAWIFQQNLIQGMDAKKDLAALEKAERLYTGDYFAGMDWVWAEAQREKISRQYDGLVLELAALYIGEMSYGKAEELLLKTFQKNPYLEDVSVLLINLYKMTGRRSLAVKHYQFYERLLIEELGVQPGYEIKRLLNER